MVRRPESPLNWSFKGFFYFMSQERGTFDEMGKVCARYGMYRWAPSSMEEAKFIERQILPNLKAPYSKMDRHRRTYFQFWVGITDKPNGNCTVTDLKIKCPVTRYAGRSPSYEHRECVVYRSVGGMTWDDVGCYSHKFAFCKGSLP